MHSQRRTDGSAPDDPSAHYRPRRAILPDEGVDLDTLPDSITLPDAPGTSSRASADDDVPVVRGRRALPAEDDATSPNSPDSSRSSDSPASPHASTRADSKAPEPSSGHRPIAASRWRPAVDQPQRADSPAGAGASPAEPAAGTSAMPDDLSSDRPTSADVPAQEPGAAVPMPVAPPPATAPSGSDGAPVLPSKSYRARRSSGSTSSADLPYVARHSAVEAPGDTKPDRPIPTTPAARTAPAAPVDRAEPRTDPAPPRRTHRRPVLVGALVLVVVVVLAAGYGVWRFAGRGETTATGPIGPATGVAGPVPDNQILSPDTAVPLDATSTWTVASDDSGTDKAPAVAACEASARPTQPTATRLRTLTGSASDKPAALHQVDVYADEAQARAAFDQRAAALGTCSGTNATIMSATGASGLGDEAIGEIVKINNADATYHTVVINRTGTLINVLDVARASKNVSVTSAASVVAGITDAQCSGAHGGCAAGYKLVRDAPPPAPQANPGFMVAADLPVVDDATPNWTPGAVTTNPDVSGTRCERVDFAAVKNAKGAAAVTYVPEGSDAAKFGLDTVVITMKSGKDASELATTLNDNIEGCHDKLLTATVSNKASFNGSDASGDDFSGTGYTVTQKVDDKTTYRYRVGVAAVGSTVVYLFANPSKDIDFTDDQWASVNVRAAQRASQLP